MKRSRRKNVAFQGHLIFREWDYKSYIHIYIWVNYNDLTATSLEVMVNKGNHPQMALINLNYTLPIYICICPYNYVNIYMQNLRCATFQVFGSLCPLSLSPRDVDMIYLHHSVDLHKSS